MNTIQIEHLGRMGYEQAYARQREVHAAVLAGDRAETVLIVEHDPVITVTKKPGAADHVTATQAMLEAQGVEVCQTNRGGDVTYHGPGQVVAYPIIRLNDRGLNLRQYVWALEQAIIDTLGEDGITADRDCDAVGVWVETAGGKAKIAAVGVRAERWVTMHGVALNVAPKLEHFQLIVPCGLVGRPVTSMAAVLGDAGPSWQEVADRLAGKIVAKIEDSTGVCGQAPSRENT